MEIKQLNDTKVDEIIKKAEEELPPCCRQEKAADSSSGEKSGGVNTWKNKMSIALLFLLLALSLVQSAELISLRSQIQKGQFGANGDSLNSGAQGLPSQQGGC